MAVVGGQVSRVRRSRRPRGQRPWYKRKYNALDLAGKAWNMAKYIKNLVNVEFKTHDTVIGEFVDYNGVVKPLSQIDQGITSTTRNGKSIKAYSLLLRGQLESDAVNTSSQMRLIIFRDKYNTGSTPSVSDVLEASYVGTINAPNSPLEKYSSGRFQILSTNLVSLIKSSDSSIKGYKYYSKLNSHIHFSGLYGSDEEAGQLYLLLISNVSPTNRPTANLISRLTFIDN